MKAFFQLVFLVCSVTAIQAQTKYKFDIDEPYFTIDTNWFAHEGDLDPEKLHSTPVFSGHELDTTFARNSDSSVIWYRSFLTIPDSLRSDAYTVKVLGTGNNKVYLDGKLVHEVNDDRSILWNYIVPSIYVPNDDSLHTVAIRSDRSRYSGKTEIQDSPTVMLFEFAKELRREVIIITIATAFMIFMMSAFLVLAFFHLTLFLFYKEERSNLFLGLFCLLFGSFFLVSMGKLSTNSNSGFHGLFSFVHFLLPFLPVFILGLFHSVFYGKLRPFFWYYLGAITILRILEFYEVLDGISTFISFIVSFDLIRIVIVAVRKKKPGSRIIGLGLLTSIIAVPLVIAGFIHSSTNNFMSDEVWVIIGILASAGLLLLSVPLTMSFHFASTFAKTNRMLKAQVVQVKELSEQTIRQEKEKKNILEQQKYNLELQVEERTREVMIQKKQLEEKNKNITDSINYARKIQHAILHSEEEFNDLLRQSFILFLPKDIVSGDFYWFHKKNGIIYIVCADCTGHGVPGAFMSMIGHTILDDIINDNQEVHPSDVLSQLNARVRDILKQDHGSETRDGMDITFAKFNPETLVIEVSSALRPVYLIRNNELIEIKPDKYSIGGIAQNGKIFTTNRMQLVKEDVIYFFTDGYADQFGGEKGKKFMLKKFQRLLLEIHTRPLDEQKKILAESHLEWKKDLDQVDDILVIGIKI